MWSQKGFLLLILFSLLAFDKNIFAEERIFILPLQFNYYHLTSARELSLGEIYQADKSQFLSSSGGENPQISLGISYLSPTQSHNKVQTKNSLASPGFFALDVPLKNIDLSIIYHLLYKANISFYPSFLDTSGSISIDQFILNVHELGLSVSSLVTPNLGVYGCLSYVKSESYWWHRGELVAKGFPQGFGFSGLTRLGISDELWLSVGMSTRRILKGYSDRLLPDGTKLGFEGTVPQKTFASISYQLEEDFRAFFQVVMTGWQVTSWNYSARTDFHGGIEIEVIPQKFWVRFGGFTLYHPIDEEVRIENSHLRDQFFFTTGIGFIKKPFEFNLGFGTSRIFSKGCLSQERGAVTMTMEL
ncbi:MAG: hypothetical protein AB1393_07730 [Candidatus Edwardsbacteria bacterium]